MRFMLVYDDPAEVTAPQMQEKGLDRAFRGLLDPNREPIDLCAARPFGNGQQARGESVPPRLYEWPGCSRVNCCRTMLSNSTCEVGAHLRLISIRYACVNRIPSRATTG